MSAHAAYWARVVVAVAAGAALALLVATAGESASEHYTTIPTAVGTPLASMTVAPSSSSQSLSTQVELPLESSVVATRVAMPRFSITAFAPMLAAAGLLIAAAMHRLSVSRPAKLGYYSLESCAMIATSGERPHEQTVKKSTFSRRGVAPLLTGALLAPGLFGQPGQATDLSSFIMRDDGSARAETPKPPTSAVVIPNPREWIEQNLPGCLPGKEFSRLTAEILSRQGMTPLNTVPCVGVCRDELCQPLVDEIEAEWGDAFNMSSLAGMLTLGKTGMGAAMAHSPQDDKGRERYFFMAFPHISVDTAGVGKCTRPGRNKVSSACGALAAFTNELKSGKVKADDDPLDPEYSFMKTALLDLMPPNAKADLLEVTMTAAQASQDQLEQLAAATVDTSKADYAIFVGVLVHEQDIRPKNAKVIGAGRSYLDQVYPTAFYSVVNGRKKDLIWRLDRD